MGGRLSEHPDELLHPGGGDILDVDGIAGRDVGGVDDIFLAAGGGVGGQAGRRVHLQRSADDEQDVCRRHFPGCGFDVGHRLAEKYDVRSQLPVTGAARVAQGDAAVADVPYKLQAVTVPLGVTILRPDLGDFSVQVDDVAAAGTLVQVVHILRDDRHPEVLLKAGNEPVRFIGDAVPEVLPHLIVEIKHQLRVAVPSLDGRDILHAMVVPQSASAAKSAEAAFGTDSGTGKDDQSGVGRRGHNACRICRGGRKNTVRRGDG